MKSYRFILTMLALLAVFTAWAADGRAEPEADTGSQELTSTMEVRALREATRSVDEMQRKQRSFLQGITGAFEEYEAAKEDITRDVVEATNAWLKDPKPEKEAAISLAIAQGSYRGRIAAEELGDIDEQTETLVATMLDDLHTQMQRLQMERGRAESEVARLEEDFAQVMGDLREARDRLTTAGAFSSEDFELSLEDELHLEQLRVDFEELAFNMELKRSMAAQLADYSDIFEAAEGQYAVVTNLADRIAYEARSVSRRFAHLGAAEATKIDFALRSDAYGQAHEISSRIGEAFQTMRDLRQTMNAMVSSARRLPRSRTKNIVERPARLTGHPLDWLRDFDDNPSLAAQEGD